MVETKTYDNYSCAKCGSHLFDKALAEKGVFICQRPLTTDPSNTCNTTHYFCKTCNNIFLENNFGKHNDVYECKQCGTVNWNITDRKREHENLMNQIRNLNSNLDSFLNKNKDIFG